MSEADQESRLRLFLEEYERVCKRYSLTVNGDSVFERHTVTSVAIDFLPIQMKMLRENGINE